MYNEAMQDTSEYLKLKDAARLLNVSYETLRKWIAAGKIPVFRPNPAGGIRVLRSEIDKLARGDA